MIGHLLTNYLRLDLRLKLVLFFGNLSIDKTTHDGINAIQGDYDHAIGHHTHQDLSKLRQQHQYY